MNTKHTQITDELLAAYLDGKVGPDEKVFIEQQVIENDDLQEVIDIMSDLALNKQKPIQTPIMKKSSFKMSSGAYAAGAYATSKLVQMYNRGAFKFHTPAAAAASANNETSGSEPRIGFAQAETTHGKPEMDIEFDPETYQYYPDSCAFQSQSIVLKEFGIDVSQEELMEVAKAQGWYVEGYGTPLDKVGKLLEHYNVPTTFTEGNNVFNLTNELAQGHRVIVTVDANELWHDGVLQDIKDAVIGETPNHALVVVGVDTSDPDDVKVIVTDPGNGNLQMAYSEKQFVDAWKDSNCFMAATDMSPEEFIDHVPPTHMDEFAGIPYSSIERLSNYGIDSGLDDFDDFVSAILLHPENIDDIIEEYPDLFNDDGSSDDDGDGFDSTGDDY